MIPTGTTYPIEGTKSHLRLCTARLTGAGAGVSMVNADSALLGGGEVTSATFVSTGLFDVVFKHKWPEAKCNPVGVVTGTTVGLMVGWVSCDLTAGTGRIRLTVGNTVTDPATTDSIHLLWVARDSGKNA